MKGSKSIILLAGKERSFLSTPKKEMAQAELPERDMAHDLLAHETDGFPHKH